MPLYQTRRHLLLGGAGAMLASLTVAEQGAHASAPSTEMEKLDVVPYQDKSFSHLLTTYYPSLAADGAFSSVAPVCCLLRNRSDALSIRALSLHWLSSNKTGGYVHPIDLELSGGHHSVYSGQRMLAGPQGILLVSPFFGWHPRAVPPLPIDWSAVIAGTGARCFVAGELLSSSHFEFAVRAVLYSNGMATGPHAKRLLRLTTLKQAGGRDAAVCIGKNIRRGASADQLNVLLQRFVQRQSVTLRSAKQRSYEDGWREQSIVMLQMLRTSPATFVARVRATAMQTKLRPFVIAS